MVKTKIGMVLLVLALCTGACALIEKPIVKRLAKAEPAKRPYLVEPKFVQAGDLQIAYEEAGAGPWLVLVHGGVVPESVFRSFFYQPLVPRLAQATLHAGAIATADSWNYNLEALAKNYHVIAIDLPGFGASDKPEVKYTREFFVSCLEGFMKAKGIDKASFIGHDLGGEVVLGYALDHPDKVDRIILVNPYGAHIGYSLLKVPRPMLSWWQREKAARINVAYALISKAVGEKNDDKLLKYSTNMAMNQKIKNASPEDMPNVILLREGKSVDFINQVVAYRQSFPNTRGAAEEVRALHSALRESRRNDMIPRFKEIKAPVLIVYGKYTPFVQADAIAAIDEKVPDSSLVVYSRSSHYPMVEESERFNSDVLSFLTCSRPTCAVPALPAPVVDQPK